MQDIRDELAHCIGVLEGEVITRAIVNDVIDRLAKLAADLTPQPVDIPTDATRANLVDHRLSNIEEHLYIVCHRIEETVAGLRGLMQNPNLHPSVKLLADTIAINLLANPTTDEEPTR